MYLDDEVNATTEHNCLFLEQEIATQKKSKNSLFPNKGKYFLFLNK